MSDKVKLFPSGHTVRVWPRGDPSKGATGKVILAAGNGNSLAVSFGEDYVPFLNGATGMALHPDHGKMLLVHREDDGIWYDVFQDGGFEIAEVQ